MRLTLVLVFLPLAVVVGACGGSEESASPAATTTTAGSTSTAAPPLAERAELLSYDDSAPLGLEVRGAAYRRGAEVEDVVYEAAGRRVAAYLVRPKGKPKAAVLWAHWYGEANSNRSEFLPDATTLAAEGVVSLLPQGMFPWKEPVSEDAKADLELIVDQTVQLRRGLDVLQEVAGDVPVGFVGHDYGAMFGVLLVADERPQTYVLMAPDATFSNWFLKYFVRGASKPEMDETFAPVDPVNNVGDAAPASVFLQFAESDRYVPYYVADKLTEAASDPSKTESYAAGHELDDAARKDRLAWLRRELGLSD
jgi:dienelactone hydrolase